MPRLIGKRIVLREFIDEDLEGIRDWVNNPNITDFLSDYDIFIYPHSYQESSNFLNSSKQLNPDNIKLVIANIKNNEYLGQINIFNIDWKNSRCSFDIVLKSETLLNQGYGQEVGNLLIDHIFETMNLRKIEIKVHSENERALRLAEKLGFVEEGILRKHIFQKGKYIDINLFGLIKS